MSSFTSQSSTLKLNLSTPGPLSSKALVLHSLLSLANLYSELQQLYSAYKANTYPLFYFSHTLSNGQLFVEFLFEVLNEQSEPLVLVCEALKVLMRFREYYVLVKREGVTTYIGAEAYKEMKELKEIQEEHFGSIQERRRINEEGKQEERKKHSENESQEESIEDVEGSDQEIIEQRYSRSQGSRQQQSPPQPGPLKLLIEIVVSALYKMQSLIANRRYHLSDIIAIIRPLIYIQAIIKYGRKSYQPIKIILVLDCVMLLSTMKRLNNRRIKLKGVERKELERRVWSSIFKYLLRAPIYENYTSKVLDQIMRALKLNSTIEAIIRAVINYLRYYTYVA